MRISDWSSDVCSSDLLGAEACQTTCRGKPPALGLARRIPRARGQPRRTRPQAWQRAGQDSRSDTGYRDRQAARQQQETVTENRAARHPRPPALTGDVLRTGTRHTEVSKIPAEAVHRAAQNSTPDREATRKSRQAGK